MMFQMKDLGMNYEIQILRVAPEIWSLGMSHETHNFRTKYVTGEGSGELYRYRRRTGLAVPEFLVAVIFEIGSKYGRVRVAAKLSGLVKTSQDPVPPGCSQV